MFEIFSRIWRTIRYIVRRSLIKLRLRACANDDALVTLVRHLEDFDGFIAPLEAGHSCVGSVLPESLYPHTGSCIFDFGIFVVDFVESGAPDGGLSCVGCVLADPFHIGAYSYSTFGAQRRGLGQGSTLPCLSDFDFLAVVRFQSGPQGAAAKSGLLLGGFGGGNIGCRGRGATGLCRAHL